MMAMTMLEPQSTLFDEVASAPNARNRRNDVRKGDAAEMFVIAKLLSWGYDAHDARRDLPYDVLVDLGSRVCRLQVKCRSHPQNDRWSYRVMRGNWRSATGTYGYQTGDYDAAVFFALTLEKALFVPGIVPHATFRTEQFLCPGAEIDSWLRVVATITDHRQSN